MAAMASLAPASLQGLSLCRSASRRATRTSSFAGQAKPGAAGRNVRSTARHGSPGGAGSARAPPRTRPRAAADSAAAASVKASAKELVDELLRTIPGTDRGASADEATRKRVEEIVTQLEAQGLEEPLKSPLIFGDYDVTYTSSPTAAGGYYRSLIGRAVLNTEEMMQNITPPNGVGNLVRFKGFSAIPGDVSLKGTFQALDNKWVEVTFEPPQLKFGPFNFSYGGQSTVKLATTYLDERVRLGRGSRGSLFVFVRRV